MTYNWQEHWQAKNRGHEDRVGDEIRDVHEFGGVFHVCEWTGKRYITYVVSMDGRQSRAHELYLDLLPLDPSERKQQQPEDSIRRGWRVFNCVCGMMWAEPTRDRFSGSGETCPKCDANCEPERQWVDASLQVNEFGNLLQCRDATSISPVTNSPSTDPPATFTKGQKVRCIDAGGATELTEGREYTVTENHGTLLTLAELTSHNLCSSSRFVDATPIEQPAVQSTPPFVVGDEMRCVNAYLQRQIDVGSTYYCKGCRRDASNTWEVKVMEWWYPARFFEPWPKEAEEDKQEKTPVDACPDGWPTQFTETAAAVLKEEQATTLVPWESLEEVPTEAWFRLKDKRTLKDAWIWRPIEKIDPRRVDPMLIDNHWEGVNGLFDYYEYTLNPRPKEPLVMPCGKMVNKCVKSSTE